MKRHPAERFSAPASIQAGTPLKDLMGARLVRLIGESLNGIVPGFDAKQFRKNALREQETLGLMERAEGIARAMSEQLPDDFDEVCPLLIASLGAPLEATEGNGLATFYYLPHARLIAGCGVSRFESGMRANYELTQRFTGEFSIRPFLVAHRDKCLKRLHEWAGDSNPHVRRLVTEGTRPRLPWAMRLPEFQRDPGYTLGLLELLKDDPELYVRRSVANHLADIAKDHAEVAYEVCERWLEGLTEEGVDAGQAKARRWVVRHALRLPAKKGDERAVRIRKSAAEVKKGK